MEYRIGPIKGCEVGDCGDNISVGNEIAALTKPREISWAKRPIDYGETWPMKLTRETLEPLSGVLLDRFGPIFEYEDSCKRCPKHDASMGKVMPSTFNDILSNS